MWALNSRSSDLRLQGVMGWLVAAELSGIYAKYVHSSLVSRGAPGSHHDINSVTGPTARLPFPPSICSPFFSLPSYGSPFLFLTLFHLLCHLSPLFAFGQMQVKTITQSAWENVLEISKVEAFLCNIWALLFVSECLC